MCSGCNGLYDLAIQTRKELGHRGLEARSAWKIWILSHEPFFRREAVSSQQPLVETRPCNMVPTLLFLGFLAVSTNACHAPEAPKNGRITVAQSATNGTQFSTGTIIAYVCLEGFDILGPRTQQCGRDGSWQPKDLPMCLSNVVTDRPAFQSSGSNVTGMASLALDGNKTTCSKTDVETSPWFAVDLRETLPIAVVQLDFKESIVPSAVQLTVRVGDVDGHYDENPVCSVFKGALLPGRSLYLPCTPGGGGRFVSVHSSGPASLLSLCEFVAYSETAASKEPKTSAERHTVDAYVPFYSCIGLEGLVAGSVAVALCLVLLCVCCCLKKFRKCWFSERAKARFPMFPDDTPQGKFHYVERPAKCYGPTWAQTSQEFPLPPGGELLKGSPETRME